MVLRDHRGPLSADLRRYYHCNLTDVLAGEVAPLEDVAAWVANLPVESALLRAMEGGRVAHTHDLELLRAAEHSLRLLVWAKTKDAEKGRNYPEPYLFPWEDDPRPGFRGDAMTTDEAAEFLGWTHLHAV